MEITTSSRPDSCLTLQLGTSAHWYLSWTAAKLPSDRFLSDPDIWDHMCMPVFFTPLIQGREGNTGKQDSRSPALYPLFSFWTYENIKLATENAVIRALLFMLSRDTDWLRTTHNFFTRSPTHKTPVIALFHVEIKLGWKGLGRREVLCLFP